MMNDIFSNNITIDPCETNEEGKLSIHIKRQDIIDLFCMHGEDGLGELGGYVGNLLAEQIGTILRDIPDKEIQERRIEIFKIAKEKRDATRNTDK